MNYSLDRLMERFNATDLDQPFVSVTEQIRNRARLEPDTTAIIAADRSLTYGELDQLADRVAVALMSLGVGEETLVAFVLGRSSNVYVVEQGIHRAGGAFTPMLPDYPDARIKDCLDQAQCPLLITTEEIIENHELLRNLAGSACRVVTLSELFETGAAVPADEAAAMLGQVQIKPETLAVCIFTSGSTGKPKGVLIEHRTLANNVTDHELNAPYRDFVYHGQNVAVFAPITFSVPITFDLLALCHGRTICFADENQLFSFNDSAKMIMDNGVTSIFCTPSYLSAFIGTEGTEAALSQIRGIILGGEGCTAALAKEVYRNNPDLTLMFGYGCSETAAAVTLTIVDKDVEAATIGGPLVNTKLYVLDDDGNELGPGEKGQLLVCGPAIARGYLGLPEETERAFIEYKGLRAFMTGDAAMWTEDGQIQLFGRLDDMVKINGLRVELGEIESVMAELPGIGNCKVLMRRETENGYLAAFYTAEESLTREVIREHLMSKLPYYMVPGVFVKLDRIPLNANGKIDRKLMLTMPLDLAEIADSAETEKLDAIAGAANDEKADKGVFGTDQKLTGAVVDKIVDVKDASEEGKLIAIIRVAVAEVLKRDPAEIGITVNLLALGMTSLGAMSIAAIVTKKSGHELRAADILRQPYIKDLAELLGQTSADNPVLAASTEKYYPLRDNQKGLFVEWELNPESTGYNITSLYRFENISAKSLAVAARAAVDNNPALKTRIRIIDGQPLAVRCDDEPARVTISCCEGKIRPFDLINEPLYRVEIVEHAGGVDLFTDIHHIVYDGMSAGLFMSDLSKALEAVLAFEAGADAYDEMLRQAAEEALTGETISAFDLALYEQRMAGSDRYVKAEEFYGKLVSGADAASYHSYDEADDDGVRVKRACQRVEAGDIEAFCALHSVTAGSFWHAAFAEALRRLTGDRRPLYLTVSSGRSSAAGLENTSGMLVKTIPVALAYEWENPGQESVEDYLTRAQDLLIRCYENDCCSYAGLVEKYGVRAEIMFIYQGDLIEAARPVGAVELPLEEADVRFPVEISVTRRGEAMEVAVICDGGRYSSADAERLAAAVSQSAMSMLTAASVGDISLVSADEQAALLSLSRGQTRAYPEDRTWVDAFLEIAAKAPERIAAVDETSEITYGELDRQSDLVADYLAAAGTGKNEFVAVKMGRVKEFIVAVLGIHKIGAAYVAIDESYPEERISYILEDADANIVITEKLIAEILDGTGHPVAESCDGLEKTDVNTANNRNHKNKSVSDGIAYMAYTSGSTGKPKGIIIPHRAMLNFVMFVAEEFKVTDKSRLSCHCSFSSDVSLESIFTSLISGGRVYIVPERERRDVLLMREFIKKHGITGGSYFTQSGQLLGAGEELELEYISLIGEKMTSIPAITGHVYNTYGPTENIEATYIKLDKNRDYSNIPVGRPMHNCMAIILDSCDKPLPKGAAGEICLAGRQLAQGYWKKQELTDRAFSILELEGEEPFRIYHTGDLGRYNEDGDLEFLGRIDFQVKLSGYRIEPGEIEANAAAFEGIRQVVAVVKKGLLCLYFTADQTIDKGALRARLSAVLADYMVPSELIQLDEMPLTPNGKIKREALPEPESIDKLIKAPADQREAVILAAASEVLGIDESLISTDANLIALGLSSLKAMKLGVLIHEKTGNTLRTADIIRSPYISALAGLTAAIKDQIPEGLPPLTPGGVLDQYPLTENQKGVYIDCQLSGESLKYNLPYIYRFDGKSAEELARALSIVADAHSYVKSQLTLIEGRPFIRRMDEIKISPEIIYMETRPEEDFFRSLVKPFALKDETLSRFSIIECRAEDASYLFMDFHHMIFDGFSADIFLGDIKSILEGGQAAEEGLIKETSEEIIEEIREEITAFDYSLYEEKLEGTVVYRRAGEYFAELVKDAVPVTYPASAEAGGVSRRAGVIIGAKEIDDYCRRIGVTRNSFWHAAFSEALYRMTRERNPLYATISSGRAGLEGLMSAVGMFVRTIPVKYENEGDHGSRQVADVIRQVQDQLQESTARDFYPYTKLVDQTRMKADIMFAYQGAILEGGNLTELVEADLVKDQAKFPVDIVVYPKDGSFVLTIDYDRSLYSEEDMDILARAIAAVAESMTSAEVMRGVSTTTAEEERLIISQSRGQTFEYDRTMTWVDHFRQQAARRPDAIAVTDGTSSYTYAELDQISDIFASWLTKNGIKSDEFAAVRMDRVKEFSAAVLGIHKAGAAYIPIDLDYPEDRVAYMLEDSETRFVITKAIFDKAVSEEQAQMDTSLRAVDEVKSQMDTSLKASDSGEGLSSMTAGAVAGARPEGIAYMIYTSGSTGRPKGVMIQHGALMNFIHFICRHFGHTEDSRITCHINFAFDASVEDLFPVLTVGGRLYIVPEDVRRDVFLMRSFIKENCINGGNYSTQFGQLLAQDEFLELDYINLGGEKMTAVPNISGRIFNTYGPTEFTDDSTYFELDKNRSYRNIPIGKPLYNCTAYVADELGQLVPWGASGELCLAGPQMALGYWKRPELTAERFAPLGSRIKEKVYHTGDLVRWNSDGELEYLGRLDFQVKVRGYRIELGEIEAAALEFEGLKQAAAEVKNDSIILYYTSAEELDQEALRESLARGLADFMVPSVIMHLDEMPLTPNGKINRRALPEPTLRQGEAVEPATEEEEQLLALATEIIGTAGFGVTDNLISLGMTSIGAMKLSMAVERELGIELRVAEIMMQPDVRELAAIMATRSNDIDAGCSDHIDAGTGDKDETFAAAGGINEGGAFVVRACDEQEYYPLMENQRGVYLDWELSRGTTEYNNPAVYRFEDIDADALFISLEKTVNAHPYLKTVLALHDGQLVQKNCANDPVAISVTRLDAEPTEAMLSFRVRPFDLIGARLYRFEIMECPDSVYLFMDIHHIIFDGLSSDIFRRDLKAALGGAELKTEGLSAFDMAVCESHYMKTQAFAALEDYFEELAGAGVSLSYPVSQEPDGVRVGLASVRTDRARIDAFARKLGQTASTCWHAAFAEAASRLTRTDNFVYTTVSNGRAGAAGLENAAGMFAKTLPVAIRTEGSDHGEQAVSDYVRELGAQLVRTFASDIYPFTYIANRHGISVDIMFNYREAITGDTGYRELVPQDTKFPLEFTVYPDGDEYVLVAEYDGTMYSREDMDLLCRAVVNTLINMTTAAKVKDVSLVSNEEYQSLMELSKGMEYHYDATKTWLDMFAARVEDHADCAAVADESSSITYIELDRQSDRLAAYMSENGVGRNDFVVVRMGRVKEFMTVVIAAHKIGAAYVPIDLEYPEERAAYMLENSEAKLTVDEALVARALEKYDIKMARQVLDRLPAGTVCPENIAYMIYTSGSTGRPKGVMIPQRALLNFVHCIRHHYRITENSRITLPKNFAFDASIEDMYPCLTKGGTLFIVSEEVRHDAGLMLEFIKANKINGGGYPTQIGQMIAAEESLEVEYLTAGGEAMTLMPKARKGRIINVYGPTEFTDDAAFFEIDKTREYKNIPIGRPLYNNRAFISDRYGQLLPQGAMGELCLAGPQMALGYWKLPELTREKFCLLSEAVPLKVYHTGDLARWNNEDQLEYMGRFDFQVKLRGYRIELGEIEVRAGSFEGIHHKVAVVKNDQLCLYYTADRQIDKDLLRSHMAAELADFMVPAVFVQLDKMSLTPNGKINRGALPDIEFEVKELQLPQSPAEEKLYGLACEILGSSAFGVTDNLISAGMNSLSAMRFGIEAKRRFDMEIRVASIMRSPVIRELAAMVEPAESKPATLAINPRRDTYPLTQNQLGIYLDWELNKDTTQYNIPLVYKLTDVTVNQLESAIKKAAQIHTSLNARLRLDEDSVCQVRDDEKEIIVSISESDHTPDEAYFSRLVRPFDLMEGPLYRFEIIKAPAAIYLFMDVHHIIFDGLSADILIEDIMTACQGGELKEETASAWDYALYERQLFESGALVEADRYFDELSEGAVVHLFAGREASDGGVRIIKRRLSDCGMRDYARACGVTVSSLWQAVFAETVSRLTDSEKILYVTVSNGRGGDIMLERTVGMFAKTLPVVSAAGGLQADRLMSDYVKAMHDQLGKTLEHDFYPYTRFAERSGIRAEAMFIYQDFASEGGNSDMLESYELVPDAVKFPLEVVVYPDGDGFSLSIQYDLASISDRTAEIIMNGLAGAGENIANTRLAGDLCLVSSADAGRILDISRGEDIEYDRTETWVDLFRKSAAMYPDNPAVADKVGQLTYRQLDMMSDMVASHLAEIGVGRGDLVGLMTGRVKEYLALMLGINKAGAAFVPIDPAYPEERISYILSDCGARLTLTEADIEKLVAADNSLAADDTLSTTGDGLTGDWFTVTETTKPQPPVAEDLAYVIYTSGSTGRPKGVMQSHRSLRAFAAWRSQLLNIGPSSRHAEQASFAFDASLDDLVCPLTAGGFVYIIDEDTGRDPVLLKDCLEANRIRGLTLPTQLGMELINQYPDIGLDFLMMGGEKMLPSARTSVKLINGYGPTEFTVCSSYHIVDQERDNEIPIGRPVPGTMSLICDSYGNILPYGASGHLLLAGPQLAEGYLNMPELTESSFVTVRLPGAVAGRGQAIKAYKTGDIAHWNEKGQLVYEGRRDSQVKIRGYRIEPEEIEAAASSFAGVKAAAVKIIDGKICLYYTEDIYETDRATDSGAVPGTSTHALREYLAEKLASFMMPAFITRLDAMPLTANGKVDRAALIIPETGSSQPYVAPETEGQQRTAACMGEVLGIDQPVGLDDNFFELGGDSIKAIRFVSLMRRQGLTVSVADIMTAKTVRQIAIKARETGSLHRVSQESIEGAIADTAIVGWFKAQSMPYPEQFAQAVLFKCQTRADISLLQKALDAVVVHHDMLRAVYRDDQLYVRNDKARIQLEEQTLESDDLLAESCAAIYTGISMKDALMRAALIHGSASDYLFVAIHHLAVDRVSWRILHTDLEDAVRQLSGGAEQLRLHEKTSSYRDYSRLLQVYRNSYGLELERPYWKKTIDKIWSMGLYDTADQNRTYAHTGASMTVSQTERFFSAPSDRIGADYEDLLLTGLVRSYCRVMSVASASVELEGHGRNDFAPGLVTDRTVGWFTSMYPLVIEGIGAGLLEDALNVKEALHRVPDQGFGYNVIRTFDEGQAHPVPKLLLNYLGVTDETEKSDSFFRQDNTVSLDDVITNKNHVGPGMAVNCLVSGGCFSLTADYDTAIYTEESARAFAEGIISEMNELSAMLENLRERVLSPSDLGEYEWSMDEFKEVIYSFESRGEHIGRIYPLMPMQEEMLLKHLSEPESHAYRLADIYELDVLPTEGQLRGAADGLALKHEVFRTAIISEGAGIYRQAVTDRRPAVDFIDISKAADKEAEIIAIRERILDEACMLQTRPLIRLTCAKKDDHSCYLIFAVHHIIVDGWCTDQYMEDFRSLLDDELAKGHVGQHAQNDQPASSHQIANSSLEQSSDSLDSAYEALSLNEYRMGRYEAAVRELLKKDRREALAYWGELLSGCEKRAELPSYGPISEEERSASDQYLFALDASLTRGLTELAVKSQATVSNCIELLWGLVLQIMNRTDDVVFAKVVSGRDNFTEDVEDLVGLFINTVPVRVQTDRNTSAAELLSALQDQAAKGNPYDFCPLSQILGQTPLGGRLIQSVIAYENYDSGRTLDDKGHTFNMKPVLVKEESFGQLHIASYIEDGELCLCVNFDTTMYRISDIERAMKLLKKLAAGIVKAPHAPLCELALMDAEEESAVVSLSATEDIDYDRSLTWLDHFSAIALDQPDSLAVSDRTGSYTYAELDRLSDSIAAYLTDNGVHKGSFVAVKLGRVKEFIAAIAGIHKAGAAYVPVDPEYPAKRVEYMLTESGAAYVIDENNIGQMLATKNLHSEAATNASLSDGRAAAAGSKASDASGASFDGRGAAVVGASPDGLAYMIYTSGSTGRPKGVMVNHKSLTHFTIATMRQNELGPDDRISHHFSFSFDSHIEDVFPVLCAGASIHIMDEETRRDPDLIYRFIKERGISGGGYTTSVGRLLITGYDLSQRYITCIGEPLTGVTPGRTTVVNRYGPTECTNVAALYRLEEGRTYGPVPIGRPMPGGSCFIVDAYGRLLPAGVAGELCYAGVQVSEGYHNMPEKTAEAFEPCPFIEGAMMYHTGDLARYNEAGILECFGRIDNQIKHRGFRIEPSEIESAAMSLDGVKRAAMKLSQGRLCLYYTGTLSEADLKAGLMEILAEYMMPDVIIMMDKLPETPNGKLDRRSLPEAPLRAGRAVAGAGVAGDSSLGEAGESGAGADPASPLEERYLAIAREFLPQAEPGPLDDLMELGMNSVTVMRYVMRLKTINPRIKVADLMRFRSVRGLINGTSSICWLYDDRFDESKPVVIALQGIMPLNGMMSKYEEWSRDFNVLVFEPTDEHIDNLGDSISNDKHIDSLGDSISNDEHIDNLGDSISYDEHTYGLGDSISYDELLDRYLELIEDKLPAGTKPAGFFGSSWGGELAGQLAARYSDRHGTKPFVVMLDTFIMPQATQITSDAARVPEGNGKDNTPEENGDTDTDLWASGHSLDSTEFLTRYRSTMTEESFTAKYRMIDRLSRSDRTLRSYDGQAVYINAWKNCPEADMKAKLASAVTLFKQLEIIDFKESDHYDLFLDQSLNGFYMELLKRMCSNLKS